jgi:glycosyltransferase involved in cell wall biosynthesis
VPAARRPSPRVTIGVPVHNGDPFLEAALLSLLEQDFEDFELVIADNASDDGTEQVCRRLVAEDPRVKYLRSEINRGAAWNFNRLVAAAAGEYFKWAAFDDLHGRQYLRRTVDVLDADPDVVLAHAETIDIDSDGRELKVWTPEPRATANDPVLRFADVMEYEHECFQAFGLIRLHSLRRTGLIGAYSSSDRVLLAELALHGRFFEVPEQLFLHREHPGRSIRIHPEDQGRAAWFDPSLAQKVQFPYWRLAYEFHKAALRAPLSLAEHTRAEWAVAVWMKWHRHTLVRQAVGGFRQVATRPRPKPSGAAADRTP